MMMDREALQQIASHRHPKLQERMIEPSLSVELLGMGSPTDAAILAEEMLKLDQRLLEIERGLPA